jgi:hypothetical protein
VELKIEKIESINSKIETTQKLIEQLYKKKEADTTPN